MKPSRRNALIFFIVVAALVIAVFSLDWHDPNVQTEAALPGAQDAAGLRVAPPPCNDIADPVKQAECRYRQGEAWPKPLESPPVSAAASDPPPAAQAAPTAPR